MWREIWGVYKKVSTFAIDLTKTKTYGDETT